jgi:hypothetical protein
MRDVHELEHIGQESDLEQIPQEKLRRFEQFIAQFDINLFPSPLGPRRIAQKPLN